jgi:hypothetical protein
MGPDLSPPRALENRIRHEHAVGELIECDALARGLRVMRVDGSRDLAQMAHAVEEIFAPTIATGPRASERESRRLLRRQDNLLVLRQVSTYFERRPGAGDPATSPVPFACECGGAGCAAHVRTTLLEAQRVFHRGPGELLVSTKRLRPVRA